MHRSRKGVQKSSPCRCTSLGVSYKVWTTLLRPSYIPCLRASDLQALKTQPRTASCALGPSKAASSPSSKFDHPSVTSFSTLITNYNPVTLQTERHPPLSQHFGFNLPYPLFRKPTSTQTSRIQATALPLPVPPNPQVLSFSRRECLQFPFIVPLTPGFEADLRPCIGAALHPWP